MSDRLLRIRIRTVGAETVTRAVRGITQGARAAQRAQVQAERQTTREAQQSARAREQAAQRASAAQARAAQQAARAESQASARAARDEQRNANEVYRTRMRLRRQQARDAQRAAREEQRLQRGRWQMAGMAGGALLGAGRAIYGRVQGYQAALGMPSRDELVTSYLDRQRSTIRLARQAGLSTADLNARVDSVATRTGVAQSDLLGGLQYAQATLATPDFNALDVFSRHLEEIANASYATGAPIQDLIGALGQMRNQFGITEDDFTAMIGAMVQMANEGSIEIGDLAANFTSEMGQFRQLRSGVSGVQAAREFAGTAEVIGRALPQDSEGAATQFRAIMSTLASGRAQRGIEAGLRRGRLGARADVFDRQGHLTVDMPELLSRMREAGLDSPAALESAGIRNVRARQGFATLLSEDPQTYADLVNSSSDAGNTMIADTNRELRASQAGQIDMARARAEANFQAGGADTVATMVELATATTELQTRFPALTEAMSTLSDVMSSMGLGGIAGGIGGRLLAGGGIAGALGLASTTGVAGGAGATAAGGLTVAGVGGMLAPLVPALGAIGYNLYNPEAAGETVDSTAADAARARGGLDIAARDELIRQRQGLDSAGAGELQRQVAQRAADGVRLHPEDIRALAAEIGRSVGREIPAAPAASSLGTGTPERRIASDRRG